LMLAVSLEVEDKLRRMLRLFHRLERRHLDRATEAVSSLITAEIPRNEVVDGLSFDDAVLLCACLERYGLKAGRDYGVYQCGTGFGISINPRYLPIIRPMIRDLRTMRIVGKIAVEILSTWRKEYGKRLGDVYEALDFAHRIVEERNRLSHKRCPACGRFSGAVIKGVLRGDFYIIYARRLCCNYRERSILWANRDLWRHRPQSYSPQETSSRD